VASADQARTPGKIRIVIADDYPRFRDALQRVIDAEPDMAVVAALGDGAAALEDIRRLGPDVAVLDVRMPGLDGIEVALRLVEEQLRTRAVIVTLHWDRLLVERAVAAGVSGYVAKETALSEVVEAVRTVARGQTYVAPALSADLSGR
jgi:two-component system, NarL family, nitrate/nitrite response regulator NarL